MKVSRFVCSILFFWLPLTRLLAQGPPINSDTPILLGLEGKAVALRTIIVNKSQLYRDGNKISDPLGQSVRATVVPVVVPYNVTSDLLVGVIAPLLSVRSKSTAGRATSTGLSDISIFAKHVLVQVDALQETFRILGKASLKLPTGKKNAVPSLGTGSWDFSVGGVAGWIGKRFGIYGDVSYALNGSSEGYSYGSTLSYNAAVGFRISPAVYETYPLTQWNLYLEFLGKYAAKDDANGVANENSGGNTLIVAPGVQWIPSRVFLAEGALQIPALQSLNGTQLGTDIGFVVGIRLLLY
ncbi:MAG: hypothetical protein HYY49_03470 [Ignavibacteriales bacterium]|nr:hypothetical protein [Ignavibacteriales bacterium]